MTLNIQAIVPSAHVDNGIVTIIIMDRIIAPHCSLKSIGVLCVEAALGKAPEIHKASMSRKSSFG
jgi:hypothetical protein